MKGYSVGALENTKQKVSLPFFQASYLGLCKAVQLTHFRSRTRLITLCLVLYVPSLFFYLHISSFVFYLLNLFHASGLGRGRLRGASSRERGFLCHHQRPRHLQSDLGLLSWGLQICRICKKKCKICNICKICKIFKICKISKICKICLSSQLCHHHHLSWGFFQIVMTFDQGGLLFPEWISL